MSLFWASNGLNELAEFPFNLIGKLTMAFFTGHLWRVLKSCYTGWVPEQGFGAVFQMDLARSRRTVPRNEKLAILSSSGRLVGVVSCCTMGLFCGPGRRGLAAISGTEFNKRFFCSLQRGRKGNWANFVPRNSSTVQFDTKSTQCQEKAPDNQNLRTLVNNISAFN